MSDRSFRLLAAGLFLIHVPGLAVAQSTLDLFDRLVIVEKEEAEAKRVRLQWISDERKRIQGEQVKFEQELQELREVLPDPVKPRVLPPTIERRLEREQTQFNAWAAGNGPQTTGAVFRGTAINALLQILGPISHNRRLRQLGDEKSTFHSLNKPLPTADLPHYRLRLATSGGGRVTTRVNETPLELRWPMVLPQYWGSDCRTIEKLRDEYVRRLGSTSSPSAHVEAAELLDSSLELLQAHVLKRKRMTAKNGAISLEKRTSLHIELQAAVRYLETVRATAQRFKQVPSEFRVTHFDGGNIEEFLDFCYTRGFVFQEAQPADEAAYLQLFKKLQDYAHDVQFVEDWKSEVEQRLEELSSTDQQLLWRASAD